jgi:phage baseplate assembly protein V
MNPGQISVELENSRRLISNIIQYGTISEVDPAKVRAKVKSGKLTTGFLPILMPATGGIKIWRLPSIGEQVMILSPSGNTTNGVILPGLYQTAFPAPSTDPKETIIEFENGETIKHNSSSNTLTVVSSNMNLQGNVTIQGDVSVTGNTSVTGNISATGDILAGGANSNHHTH